MGSILRSENIAKLFRVDANRVALPPSIVNVGGSQYRNSTNLEVDVTMSPNGVGALDTGSVAAATLYYVYAVLDGNGDLALTASTSADSLTGFSASRKVGAFHTKGSTTDIHKAFFFGEENNLEYVATFDGTGTPSIITTTPFNWLDAVPITDNGTGNYTLNHDEQDIFSVDPAFNASGDTASVSNLFGSPTTVAETTVRTFSAAGSDTDPNKVSVKLTKQGIDASKPDWSLN